MSKLLIVLCIINFSFSFAQETKQGLLVEIDGEKDSYGEIAQQIWDYAEMGYQEEKSTALLQKTLKAAGFTVKAGVAGIPTAFVAEYGSGGPVIGILGEYDALPGLSQQRLAEKKSEGKAAGHGCGHHLFGTASMAAAIAVKNWLKSNNREGRVRFYGCPAEEGGSGKVYMVRAGLFNDVDAVLHWHPGSSNSASAGAALANKSAKFRFYGVSAHAAGFPEKGRSALDGVEAMNMMVNMMREHIPEDARIHYVITDGGKAPNVVPDFAEVYYYARHTHRDVVIDIFDRKILPDMKIIDFHDMFFVVGSKNSSNSQRLVEVAKKSGCVNSELIPFNEKLPIDSIIKCNKIGITSGASAPEKLVQNLISEIKKHCNVSMEEIVITKESVTFKLPKHLN